MTTGALAAGSVPAHDAARATYLGNSGVAVGACGQTILFDALFDEEPLRRYMVVPNAEEQGWTIGTQINELVQLNQWGPYSYSRDELVKMLDEALAGEAPAEE